LTSDESNTFAAKDSRSQDVRIILDLFHKQ